MHKFLAQLKLLGPGILVAATGVGAGDLATGALTGSHVGLAVLWAVLVGAVFKFAMNEGLTRWQLATGTTLLEGCFQHFGLVFLFGFLAYLVLWTFFVSAALMSACGVVMHAILPVWGSAQNDKFYWGIIHSAVAVALVLTGGYRLFERVMTVCIGIMFCTVVVTAIGIGPDLLQVFQGLTWPVIPDGGEDWTIALLGGIGGTLTILCYGYWIREEQRESMEYLNGCRVDLGTGYLMTAIFGIAMVIIGNAVEIQEGKGASAIVLIAEKLQTVFADYGDLMKWLFLIGAWGAVGSSLLGVWQSVPYLFADVCESLRSRIYQREFVTVSTRSRPYRIYLLAMAIIPVIALTQDFGTLQKVYAICGALLIPAMAIVLLVLGNIGRWIGQDHRNPLWSNLVLAAALLFFSYVGLQQIWQRW